MRIAGIHLSPSAVASLATCLDRAGETELAQEIGFAVDGNRPGLRLRPTEEEVVLSVLHHCPAELRPLRDAFRANLMRRSRAL